MNQKRMFMAVHSLMYRLGPGKMVIPMPLGVHTGDSGPAIAADGSLDPINKKPSSSSGDMPNNAHAK
jgi:hypothetical protein